jgi:zinc transport system substrate-binding protein
MSWNICFQKNSLAVLFGLLLILGTLIGCNSNVPAKQKPVSVTVSILPQIEMVNRITGRQISVQAIIPPGATPLTFDPTPSLMTHLSRAASHLAFGALPFEKANRKKLREVAPGLSYVNLTESLKLRSFKTAISIQKVGDTNDHHANDHPHTHTLKDPHVWLSPILMIDLGELTLKALIKASPKENDAFTANFNTYRNDLEKLDLAIQKKLKSKQGHTFLVFHPFLGYFSDRYGLHQVAIELAGKQPTAAHLAQIINHAKKKNIRAIFIQNEQQRGLASIMAKAIGGSVVAVDPLRADYLKNMAEIAEKMAQNI